MSYWWIDFFIVTKWPYSSLVIFFSLKFTLSNIDKYWHGISSYFKNFNLFISLYLKWVSFQQHLVEPCSPVPHSCHLTIYVFQLGWLDNLQFMWLLIWLGLNLALCCLFPIYLSILYFSSFYALYWLMGIYFMR